MEENRSTTAVAKWVPGTIVHESIGLPCNVYSLGVKITNSPVRLSDRGGGLRTFCKKKKKKKKGLVIIVSFIGNFKSCSACKKEPGEGRERSSAF